MHQVRLTRATTEIELNDEVNFLIKDDDLLILPPKIEGGEEIREIKITCDIKGEGQASLIKNIRKVEAFISQIDDPEDSYLSYFWDDGTNKIPIFGRGEVQFKIKRASVTWPKSLSNWSKGLKGILLTFITESFALGGEKDIGIANASLTIGEDGEVTITSTNTLKYPTVGNINKKEGTLSLWWRPAEDHTYADNRTLLDTSQGLAGIRIYFNQSNCKFRFESNSQVLESSAQTFSAQALIHLIFSWGTASKKIYRDGKEIGSVGSFSEPASLGNWLFIGSLNDSTAQARGVIYDLKLYEDQLLLEPAERLYYAGQGYSEFPFQDVETLYNHYDSSAHRNYVDFNNIPGDSPAQVKIYIRNTQGSLAYDKGRFGIRRKKDVSLFNHIFEGEDYTATDATVTKENDATTSNSQYAKITTVVGEKYLKFEHTTNLTDQVGRFRVFARVKNWGAIMHQLKIKWGADYIFSNNLVYASISDDWCIVDLGEIQYPPLDIHELLSRRNVTLWFIVKSTVADSFVGLDYIMLLPIEEGVAEFEAVSKWSNSYYLIVSTIDQADYQIGFLSGASIYPKDERGELRSGLFYLQPYDRNRFYISVDRASYVNTIADTLSISAKIRPVFLRIR